MKFYVPGDFIASMFRYYCLSPITFDNFSRPQHGHSHHYQRHQSHCHYSVILLLTKAIATVVLILIIVLKVLSLASRRPSGTLREHLSVSSPAS